MRSVVVFDSQYGNTERIARAVARTLERLGVVRVVDVTDVVERLQDADLLVAGAPTQVHGLARHQLHNLLEEIPDAALAEVAAAAFDTRLGGSPALTGRASLGLARVLRAKGARMLLEPESFLVVKAEGPLAPGEEARAEAWGESLVQAYRPEPAAAKLVS